ncbi:NAD(P)-dependent oxidoreductase [Actinacidiphila paucisporea]|uniref:Putative NADH-flavin reductase n=1 Tax=Actinacidiphila paucisporea TaxID=310782 RepID=A0A1M7NEY4_9ACTN|nr:SDR family oxidoreductase [Actinacidiphila paucisporea]SHN01948.1 Putative NADH-flavin reductase [Actinacidiphila paucisporea]
MRIAVFGSTGATGRQVVAQALAAGHEVTAFVRDPAKAPPARDGLRIAVGQVTSDQAAVTAAVSGADAVVSALGTERNLQGLRSPTVMAQATPRIVRAMEEAEVGRLVWLSGLGVGDTMAQVPALPRLAYRVLGRVYADKAAGEQLLRRSSLDWTLVYPVMLTNGARTGRYRHGERLELRGVPTVSRADVADFVLGRVTAGDYLRKIAVIAD